MAEWEGLYRGELKTYTLTFTNNGVAVNLTGAVIYLAVRQITPPPAGTIVSDADALIAKSSAVVTQIAVTDAAGGVADAYFVTADSNTLEPGTYMVGVEVVFSGAAGPVVFCTDYLPILPDYVRAV